MCVTPEVEQLETNKRLMKKWLLFYRKREQKDFNGGELQKAALHMAEDESDDGPANVCRSFRFYWSSGGLHLPPLLYTHACIHLRHRPGPAGFTGFLLISALVPDSGSWTDGYEIKRVEQQLVPPVRPRERIAHLWRALRFLLPRKGLFLTHYEGLRTQNRL